MSDYRTWSNEHRTSINIIGDRHSISLGLPLLFVPPDSCRVFIGMVSLEMWNNVFVRKRSTHCQAWRFVCFSTRETSSESTLFRSFYFTYFITTIGFSFFRSSSKSDLHISTFHVQSFVYGTLPYTHQIGNSPSSECFGWCKFHCSWNPMYHKRMFLFRNFHIEYTVALSPASFTLWWPFEW